MVLCNDHIIDLLIFIGTSLILRDIFVAETGGGGVVGGNKNIIFLF